MGSGDVYKRQVVCVYGEGDRWYQNVFAGEAEETDEWRLGTSQYNGCPTSIEEYAKEEHGGEGSDEKGRQPAYINGNCYFNGAESFNKEENNFIGSGAALILGLQMRMDRCI